MKEEKKSTINSNVKKSAGGVATQKSTKSNSKSSGKVKSEQASAKAKKPASVKEPVSEPKSEEKVLDTQAKVEQDIKTKDELTLASQEEKIKKNAGKSSTRKKAAVATAVVLLLIAGVSVPTAVYLSQKESISRYRKQCGCNTRIYRECEAWDNHKRHSATRYKGVYLCRFL